MGERDNLNGRNEGSSPLSCLKPCAILREIGIKRGILEDYLSLHPHGNNAHFCHYPRHADLSFYDQ
jgi:hypothetical protein